MLKKDLRLTVEIIGIPGHDIASEEEGRKGIIADIRDSKAWGHWKGDWNMFCNREPSFLCSYPI